MINLGWLEPVHPGYYDSTLVWGLLVSQGQLQGRVYTWLWTCVVHVMHVTPSPSPSLSLLPSLSICHALVSHTHTPAHTHMLNVCQVTFSACCLLFVFLIDVTNFTNICY